MKKIGYAVFLCLFIVGPLKSFAENKMSISELKIELGMGAGLMEGLQLRDLYTLSDDSSCSTLREFLETHSIVALGEDGKPTDISNVVYCEN